MASEKSVVAFEFAGLRMLERLVTSASFLLRLPSEEDELELCAPAVGGGGIVVADVSGRSSERSGGGCGLAMTNGHR